MKYQFVNKYGGVKDVQFTYRGKFYRVYFNNAIFETDDDETAEALQHSHYFGVDYWLNVKQQKVQDKYGDNEELGGRLESLKMTQLRSLALKGKGQLGDPKKLFKLKKPDLIDYLLQNPQRTEALMNETN